MFESENEDAERVELIWPAKHRGARASQCGDGKWDLEKFGCEGSLRGLCDAQLIGSGPANQLSLLLTGQRHDAMRILRHGLGPAFKFVYFDLPRLDVDEASASFQSASPKRLTTWLTVVRTLLVEARGLMNRKGVVAVHCGEHEAPYARLILDELFRDKRVGTVVWQKTYSARNMPGMREFTDAHDVIYLYARDKDALGPVAMKRPPKGYTNTDADPRGPWKAEHKGAKTRRDNSDFDTFQPPYRWRLAGGELPPGLWRVSPYTGVIWGKPTTPGEYKFNVEVSDSAGAVARRKLAIKVVGSGTPHPPVDIPWIFQPVQGGGAMAVTTKALPNGVVGEEYSAVLFASGGAPYLGDAIRPGSGRYWDFAKATLVKAYQADAVSLGSREPTAIPTPKKYEPKDGFENENQQSIWLGRAKPDGSGKAEVLAGYTEDATKHLKALKALNLIGAEVSTAKPEPLLGRLVNIFTDDGDLVLEAMSGSADLAAVSLKLGRRFVSLQGSSDRDREVTAATALPRLKAVVAGEDQRLEARLPAVKLAGGSYLPFSGGGGLIAAEIGPIIATLSEGEDFATLSDPVFTMPEAELTSAILTAEGFLPPLDGEEYASSIVGARKALFVGPSQFLTPELASKVASEADNGPKESPVVYYFRATDDVNEAEFQGRLMLRRIPFDLLRPEAV